MNTASSTIGQRFFNTLQDNFIFQNTLECTRGKNILDLILTAGGLEVGDLVYDEPLGASDHAVIRGKIRVSNTNVRKRSKHKKQVWNYSKGDYSSLSKRLNDIDWNNSFSSFDLDDCWVFFCSEILQAMNEFIPQKGC